MGEISGNNLKFDPDDEEQGIFFLGTDHTETKVNTLIRNVLNNLIFMIPDSLSAGKYEVEVRAILRFTSSIRVNSLNALLVVK